MSEDMRESAPPAACRPVRIGTLSAHPDLRARPVPASGPVPAPALRAGAAMLPAFGRSDDWIPAGAPDRAGHDSVVFEIAGATVLSSAGIVTLRSGEVLADTLDHTLPALDGYAAGNDGTLRLPRATGTLRGRWLSLLLGAHENHFHWLILNLGRLALLSPAERDGLDGVLVPASLRPEQREMLRLSGLAGRLEQRPVARGEAVRVEHLLLPWNVADPDGVHPLAMPWFDDLAATIPTGQANRLLYVDRRGSPLRALENEDDILVALERRGFQPVRFERLGFAGQVRAVRAARLIVGPHGAGLSNLVFARPGTRVLELLPSGMRNWSFRTLSAARGLPYDCVPGRSLQAHEHAPWIASPTHVLAALDALEAG